MTVPSQSWIDETQKLVCEFVQNDSDLGELMLDHCEGYWEECFTNGLSPQQALDRFVTMLQTTNILARFKRHRSGV